MLSGDDEKSVAVAASLLSNVATFIGSVIPSTIGNIANAIISPSVDTIPLLISAGMFVLMLSVITGIVYVLGHNRLFTAGDGRFAQLAQRYDLTQFFVVAVVMVGTVVITMYLVLTHTTG